MIKTLTLLVIIIILQPLTSTGQDILRNAPEGIPVALYTIKGTSDVTPVRATSSQIITAISPSSLVQLYRPSNLKYLTSLFQVDSLKAAQAEMLLKQSRQKKLIQQIEQQKMAAVMKINSLDSLKKTLNSVGDDTLKALLYSRIALKYMNLDTASRTDKRYYYQSQALDYTLHAIREYSRLNDSTGLRLSYNHLATVYHEQKKFTQAKWFILQSNTLAREQNDTPNVISTLLTLASIKSDIADYSLAMRDLDEALQLSVTTHSHIAELAVLKSYAILYNKLQNFKKEALVLKKRDSLLESIRKAQAEQLAKVAAQKKRSEYLRKKKLYTYALRPAAQTNSL